RPSGPGGRCGTLPIMALRISNIRLRVEEPEAALPGHIARLLGASHTAPPPWRILRKALDARDRHDLSFVYTVEVRPSDEESVLARFARRRSAVKVDRYHEEAFTMPPAGSAALAHRPVVVGSGPGGLVAAYFLAADGYRPLVLERGKAVRER